MPHFTDGGHSPEIEAEHQAYLDRKAAAEAERSVAVEAVRRQVAALATRDALVQWASERLTEYQSRLVRGEPPSVVLDLEGYEALIRAAAIHGWVVSGWPTPHEYAETARRVTLADWRNELPNPSDLEALMMPWRIVAETATTDRTPRTTSTRKRSDVNGETRAKLIAALTRHHRYADNGCLNQEPIGNNELARAVGVSPSTASAFFRDRFKGYGKYKALCRDPGKLVAALKLLNDEFAPYHLLGDASSDLAAPDD